MSYLYSNFLEVKKNSITNTFWRDVVQLICDLRLGRRPVVDLDYLSWPLWHDQVINLPEIEKKLQKCNVKHGFRFIRYNMGNNV